MKYIFFALLAIVSYIDASPPVLFGAVDTVATVDPLTATTPAIIYLSVAIGYSADSWDYFAKTICNSPCPDKLLKSLARNICVIYNPTADVDAVVIELNAAIRANWDKNHCLILCDPQRLMLALGNLAEAQKCWGDAVRSWVDGCTCSSNVSCADFLCLLDKLTKDKSCLSDTICQTRGCLGRAFGLACQSAGVNCNLERLACALNDSSQALAAIVCRVDPCIKECVKTFAVLLNNLAQVELDLDRSICALISP